MKLVPFHVEHLWHLDVELGHNLDGRGLLLDQEEWVIEILTGQAWSLLHGDRIVACGGRTGIEQSDAPFCWWVLFEKVALQRRVEFTRILRGALREHARAGDIAHAVDAEAAEWLEVMGFALVGWDGDAMRYEWPA